MINKQSKKEKTIERVVKTVAIALTIGICESISLMRIANNVRHSSRRDVSSAGSCFYVDA